MSDKSYNRENHRYKSVFLEQSQAAHNFFQSTARNAVASNDLHELQLKGNEPLLGTQPRMLNSDQTAMGELRRQFNEMTRNPHQLRHRQEQLSKTNVADASILKEITRRNRR